MALFAIPSDPDSREAGRVTQPYFRILARASGFGAFAANDDLADCTRHPGCAAV